MTTTTMTSTHVARLTAIIEGGGYKKAPDLATAIARFIEVASAAGLKSPPAILALNFTRANEAVTLFKNGGAEAVLKSNTATKDKRAAALALTETATPAEAAKPKKAAKVPLIGTAKKPGVLGIEGAGKAKAKKAAKAPAKKAPAKTKTKAAGKTVAVTPRAGLVATIKVPTGAAVRPDGLPVDGVDAKLIDWTAAKGGALHSVMCKELGWQRCSRRLARAAEVAGYVLTQQKEGGDVRFFAAKN